MSVNVLRIDHASLGSVYFTDDEVATLEVRHEQIVVEQASQTGNLTFVYVGCERYEFDLVFSIFYQDTLAKLDRIRQTQDEFVLYPFLLEEPLTSYDVFWPEQPGLREQWVRGRRRAQWDFPVTWKETRIEPCPSPAEVS
jgi:hypothetical protein